jgi:hypothetical protein
MQVIIAPTDFRQANAQLPENVPNWTNELYTQLKMQLAVYAIK